MEGVQNGTTMPASECHLNNIRYITKTTAEITHWNGYTIVARIKIRESFKKKRL